MSKRTFNHKDKDARLRAACERLGREDPHCLLGHRVSPHAMQLHHIAGKEFSDEMVILCSNHHDPVTDAQKDHPAKIPGCINPLENVGHALLGLDELLLVLRDDFGGHPLREFLTYLHESLQTLGLRLIDIARANPNESYGIIS